MPERTYLPIQDEALRQVHLDETLRASLLWIADRLTTQRHYHEMTPNARQMLAMRRAQDIHGDTGAGSALCALLLERMPHVDRDMSRGEYALILRRAAGKVDA